MKFLTENNREVHIYDRRKSWLKYKEKTKKRGKVAKVTDEHVYNKIIRTALNVVKYYWTNSTGGVHLRHLGYFGVYRTPHKTVSHRNTFSYVDRLDTEGYMYIPSHFTDLKRMDSFHGFSLTEGVGKAVKIDMYKNLKDGRRYTLNNFMVKEYLTKRRIK